MKKILLLAFVFSGMIVYAQDTKQVEEQQEEVMAPVEGPSISFEDTKHDFGVIKEGDKATHTFQFLNNGTEPLILTNVKASCGCTTPKWPREPIMPGETGEIQAIYNSKGRPGKFNKAITIQSNAAESPTTRVFISGEARRVQAIPTVPTKEKSIMESGSGS